MIAIDAMGGDNAPHAIVQGAINAARSGIPLLLCGKLDILEPILDAYDAQWRLLPITLEVCSQEISMGEDPRWILKKKPDSSLVRTLYAVAEGRAEAVVSAGNSGAVLVASTVICGRIAGVSRPAIVGALPTRGGSMICLDLGANVDCTSEFLYQFAVMGSVYASIVKNIANPRVALLSNGHEPYKGCAIVQKAYDRLEKSSLNFVGNIEARDLFDDRADVLVCDGFTGNVLLKTIQGTSRALFSWIKESVSNASLIQKILFKLNEPLFGIVKKKTDYTAVGGALLLGVSHPVIVAHGSSDARAIENAIVYAHRIVRDGTVSRCNERLAQELTHNSAHEIMQTQCPSVDHELHL